MKKTVGVLMFLVGITTASASTCFDISVNLSRGKESSSVLSLQNFLVQKGYLKANPNGYFGSGTMSAVKAFQKSAGIMQTGSVYGLTRAAIKKATCIDISKVNASDTSVVAVAAAATTTLAATVAVPTLPAPQVITLVPRVTSIDSATFISGGSMSAPLAINGLNFSTSSNVVLLKLQGSGRVYNLGTFPSGSTTTISVPSSFTTDFVSCGNGCSERLPVGNYDVTVKTSGGESNAGYISLKTVVSSSSSGSQAVALPQRATQVRLGTVTFSSSAPLSLETFSIGFASPSFNISVITGITLKDEITGVVLGSASPYNLGQVTLSENESKIYGIYANVDSNFSGVVSVNSSLGVKDYIAKNAIQIPLPSFLISISG